MKLKIWQQLVSKKNIIVATILMLYLSVLFATEGRGVWEYVYYIGFPNTFLIVYSHDFMLKVGSDVPFQFSLDLLQLCVNILTVWIFMKIFMKILRFAHEKMHEICM